MVLTALTAAAMLAASTSEMAQVADAFDRAQLAKDAKALERMIDDELVFIDSAGKRQDKSAFIAGWTGPDEQYNPIVLIDRTITPLGPDAFVTSAETTLSGTSGDKPFASRFRFSDTFRRVGGQWRAVHIQVTRIGE